MPLHSYLEKALIFNKYYSALNAAKVLRGVKALIIYFGSNLDEDKNLLENLHEVYKTIKNKCFRIEIIFVPTDNNQIDINACCERQKNFGWYVLNNSALAIKLQFLYEITVTPALVVVKKNGNLISKEGIKDLQNLKTEAIVSWI